jgi:hypothetical protein|tara:strand:+ start:4464 stop:4757 length:294 start_codon:yes stop_codon:yes gene_type:complete
MKITRNELRKLIIEAIEPKDVKDSEIKKAVILCLKKEGGAAGIDLLIKAVKGLETKRKKLPKNLKNKKSIARYILKMNDILKHRNGDIILTIGLPKK